MICRKILAALPVFAVLAACNLDQSGKDGSDADDRASVGGASNADTMAARDPAPGQQAVIDIPDSQQRPMMQSQVVLDRLGFTPGVVDGKDGASTKNAISGFQEANGLKVSGQTDDATKQALAAWKTIPATRVVTIPASFAAEPFKPIPDGAAKQAQLERMGYASLDEKLAERFHTTIDTLKALNPGGMPAGTKGAAAAMQTASASPSSSASPSASDAPAIAFFHAGQKIRVPNVGHDKVQSASIDDADWARTLHMLGVGSDQPKADKIVVSKSKGTLKAYGASGKLVGMYTATMGSSHDPLPLGTWKILGVAHNPPFQYDPKLFWDVSDSTAEQRIPPGPNGPVGVVWIDLSKEHYGIHGTPEPQTIGRAQSHGCVRLTNWDAARLAQMVHSGTSAVFEQ